MHRNQFSEAIPASFEASGSSTSLLLVCFLTDRLSLVVGEGGSHEPYFLWMIFDLCVQYTLGMTTLHLDIALSLVSWPGGEVVTDWRTCILLLFLNALVVTMRSRVLCPSSLQVRHIPAVPIQQTPTRHGLGWNNMVRIKCFLANSLIAASSQDPVPTFQHLESVVRLLSAE